MLHKFGAGLASIMAVAAIADLQQKMARSDTWTGLRGQRSCLKVRTRSNRKPHQGARECARRVRQMAAQAGHE